MNKRKSTFPLVGLALDNPVRRKRNNVTDLKTAKAKIKRVVERATESMVKVTGKVRDAKHLMSHLEYISRNNKIELENERGEVIDTRERMREEHKQWVQEFGKPRKNERHTVNIVLSMPTRTDPEAVRRAARDFAKATFGDTNQYVMALQHPGNDPKTKQPHVHLTVKARGYDGARLDPKKADLQEWRETFAEKMREQGYNVEATPRRSRGIVEKGVRGVVKQIMDDERRPGRSRVYRDKVQEAADALAGKPTSQNPYREHITATQQAIRKGWLEGADALDASPDADDRELAAAIRAYVAAMPVTLQDERARLRAELVAEIKSHRQREQEKDQISQPAMPQSDIKPPQR
jgi:type IV secretion system T-DNA border endonuclease VirD2